MLDLGRKGKTDELLPIDIQIYGIFQVKSAAQNFKDAQIFFSLSIL